MSSLDPVRLQALFAAALDLPDAERDAFLVRECAGDAVLLLELRELLGVDARLAEHTAPKLGLMIGDALTQAAPTASLSGMRIGPFVLREALGRGGMGTVYRGERVDGSVDQEVAIKLVRRELLDAHTMRRFQLERRLLATLDHPNIARLIDAAELPDGTPYFVMEYVPGVPITEYCRRERLDARACARLLREVCAAVAEAHHNLIVHRDLKPTNILVGGNGMPKLLDFGIAKPLQPLGAEGAGEQTGTQLRYFSPQYAAPEQLTGAPIGVACDVYALGLLLYEMLAGARPFEFAQMTPGQIERLITEVPPAAPSAMLARNDEPGATARSRDLRGDLDGIVLRCLRKAPHERYASVEQLEADLARYLDGLPIQALSGDRWYRAQKFVARHRVAVAAGMLLAVALLAGVVGIAWQVRIAERRAADLELVSRFQARMLSQVNPTAAGALLSANVKAKFAAALAKSATLPVSERQALVDAFAAQWARVNATDAARDLIDETILKPAVAAIVEQFPDQPAIDAALNQVLADRYVGMGLYDTALPLQQRALELRRRALGDDHPETLASLNGMGDVLAFKGALADAEGHFREALQRRRRVLGDASPETLRSVANLGVLLRAQGKLIEAEPLYREALAGRRRVLGADHPDTLTSINNVGALLQAHGRLDEVEPYYREALDGRRRVLGDAHPDTLISVNNMGVLMRETSRLDAAEPYFREALEQRRHVLGEEHRDTLQSISNLAHLLQTMDRLDEAEPLLQEALEKTRRVFGPAYPMTLIASTHMGGMHLARHRYDEAITLLAPLEGNMRKAFVGDNARRVARYLTVLGRARMGTREFPTAEAHLLEAQSIFERVPSPSRVEHRDCLDALVTLYGAWDAAESNTAHAGRMSEWRQRLDGLGAGESSTTHPQ